MRVARSSSDQWETGVPASGGLVVARTRTLWRSSGGKSGRTGAAREVVEHLEAVALETPPPLGDGIAVAAQFLGDVVVAWLVGLGAAEHQARPEGQALGRGAGVGQLLQPLPFVGGQTDTRGFTSHGTPSRRSQETGDNRSGRVTSNAGNTKGSGVHERSV